MRKNRAKTKKKIQQEILKLLIILAAIITLITALTSIVVNVKSENLRFDENLYNVAQTISRIQLVRDSLCEKDGADSAQLVEYLDTFKGALSNTDVISVIGKDGIRKYHSNAELIGTEYDGTKPDFESSSIVYVTGDTGPSGPQKRAYAAVYDEDGNYAGFVLAVMLNRNIYRIIKTTVFIHLIAAAAIIVCAVIFSKYLSSRIKSLLKGYEPDTFSAMFGIRDSILEALDEGILAVDTKLQAVYMNSAAAKILHVKEDYSAFSVKDIEKSLKLGKTLETGERTVGLSVHISCSDDILADVIPVSEYDKITGVLCILRDRTEYTKMMEDLSGVKYMVECMRANNHDFTNKLHVILGLIQMGNTAEASQYIAQITSVKQRALYGIAKNIETPSVAALLIGKYSHAEELGIHFSLKSGSVLKNSDISMPSGDLITIIGNLVDNAMDSMNEQEEGLKELSVGIFTQPHAIIISVDDTGKGISAENRPAIFENGFSTKGTNRGVGLYIVKRIVEKYEGTISVDSEPDMGTSFTVTLTEGGAENV